MAVGLAVAAVVAHHCRFDDARAVGLRAVENAEHAVADVRRAAAFGMCRTFLGLKPEGTSSQSRRRSFRLKAEATCASRATDVAGDGFADERAQLLLGHSRTS